MQNNHNGWQAAVVTVLCILTSPVFAQERRQDPQAVRRIGSRAHDQAETATDQALAERIRQGLQENVAPRGLRSPGVLSHDGKHSVECLPVSCASPREWEAQYRSAV
jgi:hypothetical protein